MTIVVGSDELTLGTGAQDLTIGGLGWTPKAIMLIVSAGTTFSPTNDAIFAVGVADDANNVKRWGLASMNALETADTSRWLSTSGEFITVRDAQAIAFSAAINSSDSIAGPIANGWRINTSGLPTDVLQRAVFVLIGEDDDGEPWDAAADGNVALAAAPDLMLAMANGDPTQAGVRTSVFNSIGASDGTNNAAIALEDTNGVETMNVNGVLLDDACALQLSTSITWQSALGSFQAGAPQAVFADTGTPGADEVVGLAVYLGTGKAAWVGVVDSPTDAGVDWAVAPGGLSAITPEFVMLFPSMFSAVNTIDTTGLGGTMGVGIHDGTRQHCISVAIEDGQDISDTQSAWFSKWVNWYDDAGTLTHDIEPASSPFELGGWTVAAADIATTDGTARKWIAVVVGATAGGGGGGGGGACCDDGFIRMGMM